MPLLRRHSAIRSSFPTRLYIANSIHLYFFNWMLMFSLVFHYNIKNKLCKIYNVFCSRTALNGISLQNKKSCAENHVDHRATDQHKQQTADKKYICCSLVLPSFILFSRSSSSAFLRVRCVLFVCLTFFPSFHWSCCCFLLSNSKPMIKYAESKLSLSGPNRKQASRTRHTTTTD